MKIIRDNLIYSRQRVGGISSYFNRLSFLKSSDGAVRFIRTKFLFLPDVYISKEKFLVHCTYYKPIVAINGRVVYTVHDLNFKLFEKGSFRNFLFGLVFRWSIERADGLIIISEYTKNQLRQFYPKVSAKRKVIYHGVGSRECKPKRVNKIENLLYVGKRGGYKNFIEFVGLLPFKRYNIVLVGGESLSQVEKNLLNKVFVDWTYHEFLEEEGLDLLYASSDLLIYPSSYEGFGLPIIEAARVGTPSIYQENTSCSEVGNKLGLSGFPVLEEAVISDTINSIEDNYYILSQKLIENTCIFSIDKCVNKHKQFYHEIIHCDSSL